MSIRTGIDLGTESVKLVRGEGRTRLERVTHVEVEAWDPENGKSPAERAAASLGRILGRMAAARHRLGHLAVGVGGPESGLREIVLPQLSPEEIARALPYEARRHLTPEQIAAPTLTFQILGPAPAVEDGGEARLRVLLAAIPSAQRDFTLRVLAAQGLEPEVIDLEPLANLNALLATLPAMEATDRVVALLDLGAHAAGLHVTHADGGLLSRGVGSGVPGTRAAPEVAEYTEGLAARIAETFTFYRARHRRDVAALHLAGGGAQTEGLRSFLQTALDLPVTRLDPFEGVELPPHAGQHAVDSAPRFVTACGLCRWWDDAHV